MTDKEQPNDPSVVIQIYIDNQDGLQFGAYYHKDIIDRGKDDELTLLEKIVLERVISTVNFLESTNEIFGHQNA